MNAMSMGEVKQNSRVEWGESDWLRFAQGPKILWDLKMGLWDRKKRLIACGLVRLLWDRLGKAGRAAVEAGEKIAEGRRAGARIKLDVMDCENVGMEMLAMAMLNDDANFALDRAVQGVGEFYGYPRAWGLIGEVVRNKVRSPFRAAEVGNVKEWAKVIARRLERATGEEARKLRKRLAHEIGGCMGEDALRLLRDYSHRCGECLGCGVSVKVECGGEVDRGECLGCGGAGWVFGVMDQSVKGLWVVDMLMGRDDGWPSRVPGESF